MPNNPVLARLVLKHPSSLCFLELNISFMLSLIELSVLHLEERTRQVQTYQLNYWRDLSKGIPVYTLSNFVYLTKI